MKIEACKFGEITIEGKDYTSDVIIYPDRVDATWWRKEGHRLQREDIQEIIQAAPQYLVVGTGQDNRMKIDPQVKSLLEQKGIRLFAAATLEACKIYNDLIKDKKSVISALHLTC